MARGSNIQLTHNGITYKTLHDVAIEYDLSYSIIYYLVVRDKVDITKYLDYLDGKIVEILNKENVEIDGDIYKDVLEVIRVHRLPKIKTIIELQEGETLEGILQKRYKQGNRQKWLNPIVYEGITYKSIKRFTDKIGINYEYFIRVYKDTNDIEKSIEQTKKHMRKKEKVQRAKQLFK